MKKYLGFIFITIIMCLVIFYFQTEKVGFHEDEVYTISSSVNPTNGLMTTFDTGVTWYSKDYVKDYFTLTKDNYFNIKSIYKNQAIDSHPPFFYTLVHFSSILFNGNYNKYTVFIVNIIAFILSLIVISKIISLFDKKHLIYGTIILYGMSMGTISLVLYQRMYMLLTLFILTYFYYNLKMYKNNFELVKKDKIRLSIVTVLGFLTQYFFVMYAMPIFIMMILVMIKRGIPKKKIISYLLLHVILAIIGIALFPPSIYHMLFTNRGISNITNGGFISSLIIYIKHIAYAFSLDHVILYIIALIFLIIYYLYRNDKFPMLLIIVPTIFFFIVTIFMTSFKEFRYITPIIPFISIMIILIIDCLLKSNNKYLYIVISIVFISFGFIESHPLFLYRDYKNILEVANKYKDKSFVYVYDNFFNHMQSVPEMMIYKRSIIINDSNDELKYIYDIKEDSFVISIKSYMDNDRILKDILNNTDYKNISTLYKVHDNNARNGNNVLNNIYLISK